MFEIIDDLKNKLDQHRPLSPAIVKNLQEDLIVRWTYHSNAIEGNTLTLLETKVVLEGITVGGKALREHFEAINHRNAIYYVEDIIRKEESFSEWQIRNVHQLILKNIDDDNAGHYRQQNVLISGATTTPPDYTLLNDKMAQLVDWYNIKAHKLHPIERAAKVHADFVGIHPFIAGNGRTSRLLMNLELLKAGYPPCVITVENRLAYYEALDQSMTYKNTETFIKLISDPVLKEWKIFVYESGGSPYLTKRYLQNRWLFIARRRHCPNPKRIPCEMWTHVISYLDIQWSPEQIASCVAVNLHSIYRFIRQDKNNDNTLFHNLRFRNQRKRKYGSPETCGQLSNRKSIHDRPIEIEQRTRFGDLEIDTIVGKKHQQSLVFIVDRKTSYLWLKKCSSRKAEEIY